MRRTIRSIVMLAFLLQPAALLAWDDLAGGDHAMEDWILEDGAVIAGRHLNVHRLVIPAGATVRVQARQGELHGALEIQACVVELDGTLLADAAGFPGGAPAAALGGHQGAGPGPGCGGGPGNSVGAAGSGGGHGGRGGQPDQNNPWSNPCERCDNGTVAHCTGPGGSPYGTADGEDLDMGSGGGAGGNSSGCSNAGAAGGRGGGAIKLLVDEAARIDGTISADGQTAALDGIACGYHPGGGGGAGGGIMIQAPELTGSGILRARGGRGGPSDGCPQSCGDWGWAGGGGGGGRIKLFSLDDRFTGTLQVEGGAGGTGAGGASSFNGLPGEAGTTARIASLPIELPGCAGPPRISLDDVVAPEGGEVRLQATGRDPDGGPLTWEWSLDGDGVFDDGTGPEATRTYPENGQFTVAVRATDDEGESAEVQATVTIVNIAPTIRSQPPLAAVEGEQWTYDVVADDPGGEHDPLSVNLERAPEGMTVDGLTVSWTPSAEQALLGSFLVVLHVVDDDGGSSNQNFTVAVSWIDDDGDGMADSWELRYGLDPTDPGDAAEDLDEDGLTNLEEFIRRGDPTRFGRPDPPLPVLPEDGAWIGTTTPTLLVQNGADPDGDPLVYGFEIALDPQFIEVVQEAANFPEGAEGRTALAVRRALAEDTSYWWRAWCFDGVFRSEDSPAYSFRVNADQRPPHLPVLVAPADGLPVGTLRPRFEVRNLADPDGEPIQLHLALLDGPPPGGTLVQETLLPGDQAGPQGSISWTPDEDLVEDGVYWWQAETLDPTGLSSGWTAAWSFKVNVDNGAPPAPQLLRPSLGADIADLSTELALIALPDPDHDAIWVTIELDVVPSFDTPGHRAWEGLVPGEGGLVLLDPGRLTDNTIYWWRAAATDGLAAGPWAVARFRVNRENEPPGAPQPVAPGDGARLDTSSPELAVRQTVDPDHDELRYVFEVAADPAFQQVVASSPPVVPPAAGEADQTVRWQATGLQVGESYYWRCRARDPLRLFGPPSEVWRFFVQSDDAGQAPSVPEIVSPDRGQQVSPFPILIWRNSTDPRGAALTYEVQIARDQRWDEPVARASGVAAQPEGETSWQVENALKEGRYEWRVRASNGEFASVWSAPASFRVDPTLGGGSSGGGKSGASSEGGCRMAADAGSGAGNGGAGSAASGLLIGAVLLGLRATGRRRGTC